MQRFLRLGFLPLAVLVLMLGITGFAAAQNPPPSGTPTANPHPFIPELEGIPRDQMFDHMRPSTFSFTDAQGNLVNYQMTPGTVASISATGITITPNGSSTNASFTITQNTNVKAMPADGSIQALAEGDKVMVLSRQGSDEAVLVAKHKFGMMHHFGGRGMGGGM